MCEGTITEVKCGHDLIHFKKRCPQNCERPQGPRYKLDDTCAECHLFSPVYKIDRHFDEMRGELMERLYTAVREGRKDEQPELRRLLGENSAKRSAAFMEEYVRRAGEKYDAPL